MKTIFVPKLFLWPRFHIKVNAALTAQEVDLVELRQELTPAMGRIQVLLSRVTKVKILSRLTATAKCFRKP
jgi:hypothetical protein